MLNQPELPLGVDRPTTAGGWMDLVKSGVWAPIGLDYTTPELPGETWVQHPRYDLKVSNYGRLWGRTQGGKEGFKKQSFVASGYLKIGLSTDGVREYPYVARLVYEAFYRSIPEGINVINTTDMPWDNRITSLDTEPVEDVASMIKPGQRCKRGHALNENNVVLSQLRVHGSLSCRACHNAENWRHQVRRRSGFFPSTSEVNQRADNNYRSYIDPTKV